MEHKLINVLLIEDNPGDTRLIHELFKEAKGVPTTLLCADRLSSGLQMLSKGGVDVVLLDLSLPDSKGFETFSSVHMHAKELPVIVLSGLDDEELAMEAVRDGAQDYITKGAVTSQSLMRSVRFAVERNRKMAAAPHSSRRTVSRKNPGLSSFKRRSRRYHGRPEHGGDFSATVESCYRTRAEILRQLVLFSDATDPSPEPELSAGSAARTDHRGGSAEVPGGFAIRR